MVLFMIGLGLGDEKDVTIKGVEAIKSCSRIFLEYYTAIIGVSKERYVFVAGVLPMSNEQEGEGVLCVFPSHRLILVSTLKDLLSHQQVIITFLWPDTR